MSSIGDEDIDDTRLTTDPNINGLLSAYKWSLYAREYFSYSIPDSETDYEDTRDGLVDSYPDGNHDFVFAMPEAIKVAIERSATEYEKILTFDFNNEPGHEDNTKIRYGIAPFLDDDHDGAPAYAHPVDEEDGLLDLDQDNWMSGDTFLRNTVYENAQAEVGSIEYMTILHETGHAFGLKHPHEGGGLLQTPVVPESSDSLEFTVMSYRGFPGDSLTDNGYQVEQCSFAQTPMMLDIAALQSMYGADYTTQSGDTVYRWDETDGSYFINGVKQWTPGAGKNVVFMTIWDGGGNDTYDLSNYAAATDVSLEPGGWTDFNSQTAKLGHGHLARGNVFNALLYSDSRQSLIENVTTGGGGDRVTGNDIGNRIETGNGNDVVHGNDGDDVLIGGAGKDVLDGGGGHDLAGYTTASGVTVTVTQVGAAADSNWRVDGLAEGAGDNLRSVEGFVFGGGDDSVTVDAAASVDLFGNAGADSLIGGRGDELMVGGAGSDRFTPNGGIFTVFGGNRRADGSSDDSLSQNDLLIIDKSSSTLRYTLTREDGFGNFGRFSGSDGSTALGIARVDFKGGKGADALYGGITNDAFAGGANRDLFHGDTGNDVASGGIGDDTLYGDDGNDTLNGDSADDYLGGGAGKDTLDGGAGSDRLYGGAGDDMISTGGGNDVEVFGGTGRDILIGARGNQSLSGDAGNDSLEGKAGSDSLTGGAGADRFIFSAKDGRDVILDFDAVPKGGSDRIDISALGFSTYASMLGKGVDISADGGDVVIDFGTLGLVVTLEAVRLADINAADFIV